MNLSKTGKNLSGSGNRMKNRMENRKPDEKPDVARCDRRLLRALRSRAPRTESHYKIFARIPLRRLSGWRIASCLRFGCLGLVQSREVLTQFSGGKTFRRSPPIELEHRFRNRFLLK